MMAKIRKQITLDKDLVELFLINFDIPLSTYLNNCLKEEFKTADELSKVKKAIREHEAALNILRPKECRLEKRKAQGITKQTNFAEAMHSIENIINNLGVIGELQIKNIANFRELDENNLLDHCRELGLNIVKSSEPPKPTKMSNGSGISQISKK